MKPFNTLVTTCVNSTAEKIDAMTAQARQVTYKTLRRHVPVETLREVFPFYTWGEVKGFMRMCDDYAVSFYKSVYCGIPCYYVEHSRIEYVFTQN